MQPHLRTAAWILLALAAPLTPGALLGQQAGVNPRIVETQCRACHRDKFESIQANPHSVLAAESWQQRTGEPILCRSCHGDVTEHIRAGGGRGTVFAFRDESAPEQATRCLACHADTHPQFDRSAHATAGLTCTDCHSNHAPDGHREFLLEQKPALGTRERIGATSRLCGSCHEAQLAQFDLNERHRLLDGVLECTSCHNPHEPVTRAELGGFKQSLCMGCHRDKEGPFVFEHGASRVESCTACHRPHGSPNRHLLETNRVAELCISCHAAIPQFHLGFSPVGAPRFNLDTQCTNCHSSIHGSNFHPRFLR